MSTMASSCSRSRASSTLPSDFLKVLTDFSAALASLPETAFFLREILDDDAPAVNHGLAVDSGSVEIMKDGRGWAAASGGEPERFDDWSVAVETSDAGGRTCLGICHAE
jgi:hypothetical protein